MVIVDAELAAMHERAQALESHLVAYLKMTEDVAERDLAQSVWRLAKPLRMALQTWIALRALRAQVGKPTRVGN